MGTSTSPRRNVSSSFWYCAETHYGAEQEAKRNLLAQDFEVELPLMRLPRNRLGERKVVPLFEGYIFLRECSRWRSVNGTRGVVRILANGDIPCRVLDADLQWFRDCQDDFGYFVDPVCRVLQPGDIVHPRSGRFAGIHGEFVRMKTAERAEVMYWMMGRGRTFTHPIRDLV